MSRKKKVEFTKVVGTPTMLFLPARNYVFKVSESKHIITVPRRGRYVDLDPEIFTDEDGEFDILINEGDRYSLYTPSLTKVMFAVSKYPDLEEGQAFSPIAITVKEDEVDIVGQVIEMIQEEG